MGRAPRREDPAAKKRRSLEKDRRNTYGENPKASRRGIAFRKAKVNRVNRHEAAAALRLGTGPVSADSSEQAESAFARRRAKRWRKVPDVALGEMIERRRELRDRRVGTNGRARRQWPPG